MIALFITILFLVLANETTNETISVKYAIVALFKDTREVTTI